VLRILAFAQELPEAQRFAGKKRRLESAALGGDFLKAAVSIAYVYGRDSDRISASEHKLTSDEARRISKLIQASRARRAGERPKQGQESTQAAAAPVQAGDDRRPDPRGQAAGESLRLLPA